MRKLMLVPAAILAAGMLSTAVLAQPPEGQGAESAGWHHRGGVLMHDLKALNLSDSQKASVKALFKSSREQYRPQFQAFFTQRQAFAAATPGTAEFQSATASLAQAASSAASARVQQQAELRTQIYALLTDAQKQQWATLQAQHQARMAEWQAKHEAGAAD